MLEGILGMSLKALLINSSGAFFFWFERVSGSLMRFLF